MCPLCFRCFTKWFRPNLIPISKSSVMIMEVNWCQGISYCIFVTKAIYTEALVSILCSRIKIMELWFSKCIWAIWWFHEILYSCICASYRICCMCSLWADNDDIIVIICAYIPQSFTPRLHRVLIRIHLGSVATTSKVWAIGQEGFTKGSS
jgi:hypothetical protein